MVPVATFNGKTVLITGGTGSFGRTFARRILQENESVSVRVLSRDEAKQDDMRRSLADPRVRFFVGDTRDPMSVRTAIRGATHVFHAAALKQVPSCEFFPDQAVATNVRGSTNVLQASLDAGVEAVVCLSTDKAVYPINAMGMTKALMEKSAQALARTEDDARTRIMVTRYGNVMCSRGSVIPVFMRQAFEGRDVTVTHNSMTRFLMSLDDSVDLVTYAMLHGNSGDLLVKKAPGARVVDLAQAVIEMMGSTSEIVSMGIRHGEKLHESLLSAEELSRAHDEGGFFRVPMDGRSLNYDEFFSEGSTAVPESSYTSENTDRLSVAQISELLVGLPEFDEIRRTLK